MIDPEPVLYYYFWAILENKRSVVGKAPRVVGRKDYEEALQYFVKKWGKTRGEVEQYFDDLSKRAFKDMKEAESLTNEQIVQRVRNYQADSSWHPLTCGNDSGHRLLEPRLIKVGWFRKKVVLVCPDCDYLQLHIPEIVLFHK